MQSRKSLIIFLSEYTKSAIGFVTLFFVTRLIGAEALGVVAYQLGLLGLFAIFLDLGFSTAHIKHVSEKKNLGECVGTYLSVKLCMLALYSVIILGYLYFKSPDFTILHDNAYLQNVFIILFFYYILDQLTSVLSTTFTGRQEFVKLSIPLMIGRVAKMIGALAQLIAWLFSACCYYYFVYKEFSFTFDRQILKHWLSGIVAFFLVWFGRSFFPYSENIFLNLVQVISLTMLCLVVYFICLIMTGGWKGADWCYAFSLFNPNELAKDIATELR